MIDFVDLSELIDLSDFIFERIMIIEKNNSNLFN